MEEIKKNYDKVKDIILSCNNTTQLKVAVRVFNRLLDKFGKELTDKQINTLKQLIGLMRIKCTKGKEEVSEIFNTGKDFKTQLNLSGQRELRDLAPKMIQEINIGTQIEQNHLPLDQAKELATHNVQQISDYYSNPDYCIIAVESKSGDKKTVRVEKKLYEKSKVEKDVLIMDDMEVFHENLDMNDVAMEMKDEDRENYRKRMTKKDIFDQIRKEKDDDKEDLENMGWAPLMDEEIDEATGAASSGAYVGPLTMKVNRRTFAKPEIPVSVNGLTKPIGKMYSLTEEDTEVLEEDGEIEEAVDYGGAVGAYVTPAMWAKNKSNWRGANKLAYPGGKFVNIKEKCSTYPYCDQGSGGPSGSPITLSNTSDMKIDNVFNENKIIKKSNLKLKK